MSQADPTVPGSAEESSSSPVDLGAALAVDGLTAGYSKNPIIEGVDITVRRGQMVLLVGPNGAGKSTVVKAIVGTIPRMAGRVSVLGRDVSGKGPSELARAGVAYVPQNDDVFLPMSVMDNLLMGGYLLSRSERMQRVLERFEEFPALGVARNRPASSLSGGQRKALALARALMTHPEVVILDEPTAGLAPKVARAVLEENVAQLRESGKAVLVVEQRVADALRVSDQVEVLVSGRVVLSESASAFSSRSDAARWLMGAIAGQGLALNR